MRLWTEGHGTAVYVGFHLPVNVLQVHQQFEGWRSWTILGYAGQRVDNPRKALKISEQLIAHYRTLSASTVTMFIT